jgi:flagellar hook-basal body complex protein FliE
MVQRADINSVLSEIRSMRSQMMQNQQIEQQQGLNGHLDGVRQTEKPQETPGFGDMLKQAVDQVNDVQQNAGQLSKAYEQGDPSVDIARVMIESQKASTSFEALTQVRNRVVRAYEDIMKMPV